MELLQGAVEEAKDRKAEFFAVVVKMDGFEKDEVIINSLPNFDSKLEYYEKTYDEDLHHNKAPGIRIISFAYGKTFAEIEEKLRADYVNVFDHQDGKCGSIGEF